MDKCPNYPPTIHPKVPFKLNPMLPGTLVFLKGSRAPTQKQKVLKEA